MRVLVRYSSVHSTICILPAVPCAIFVQWWSSARFFAKQFCMSRYRLKDKAWYSWSSIVAFVFLLRPVISIIAYTSWTLWLWVSVYQWEKWKVAITLVMDGLLASRSYHHLANLYKKGPLGESKQGWDNMHHVAMRSMGRYAHAGALSRLKQMEDT